MKELTGITDKEIIAAYRKSGLLRKIFGWRRISLAQLAHCQKEYKATLRAIGEWLGMQMVIGARRLEWLKPTDRLDFYFKKANLMAFQRGDLPEEVYAYFEGTLPEGMVK